MHVFESRAHVGSYKQFNMSRAILNNEYVIDINKKINDLCFKILKFLGQLRIGTSTCGYPSCMHLVLSDMLFNFVPTIVLKVHLSPSLFGGTNYDKEMFNILPWIFT